VRQLEPKHREVIEHCYFKGLKYREIADVLQVPVGTIGTRLKGARARLKEILLARSQEPASP
jgi:RNA polymerase sigma-70 factor (ECF subfamily)